MASIRTFEDYFYQLLLQKALKTTPCNDIAQLLHIKKHMIKLKQPGMFTPESFSEMPRQDQADVLHFNGTYLHTREEPGFMIDVYQVNNFYVEVYYQRNTDECLVMRTYYSADKIQQDYYDRLNSEHVAIEIVTARA